VGHALRSLHGPGRRPRRAPIRRPSRLVLEELERRWLPAPIAWTGNGDGNTWENANNWSLLRLPTPADDVTIATAGGAISINVNESVGSLTLTSANTNLFGVGKLTTGSLTLSTANGGILTGADVVVNGNFTWNQGALGGGGNLSLGGTTTIQGGARTLTLNNRQVANAGTVNWISGNITLAGGTTITNVAGATFNAKDDFTLNTDGAGTEVFNNQGSFVKSGAFGGGGTATVINCPFNNAAPPGSPNPATVESDAGTLEFQGNGTHTGKFTAGASAAIQFGNRS
jgi:hypothetical protein